MNHTNYIELKSIDNSIFDSFEHFINESIDHFHSLNRLDEEIIIYVPDYFNKMLTKYIGGKVHGQQNMSCMNTYRGIKVIDGYENKVIVAIKDAALYGIEPKEMLIP